MAAVKRRALLAIAGAAALGGCSKKSGTPSATFTSDAPAPDASGSATALKVVTEGGGTVPFRNGTCFLGAYVDLKGLSASAGLSLRRRQLGRTERIVHRYYSWTETLPTSLSYVPSASTLMVSWRGTTYKAITGGSSDKLIKAAARRIAARKSPTLVRWGWDMNRDFFPWGGPANDDDPAGYVAAYRRIRQIFEDSGATNVSWVWSPNWNSHPDDEWNQYAHYYPGDDYVDWIGVSGYADKQTPGDMFDQFYETYAPVKPIMIAEVAVVDHGGSTKPDFIKQFAAWVKAHPAVGAAVWFDTDTDPGSKEKWRVDSTAASLAAYKALADDSHFGA